MYGYRLFAISAMNTTDGQKAKDHLMEIFVRARQIGGDEAHFGLVCRIEDPASLQENVEETWDATGKIRVFGRDQLPDLANELREWIRTANR
jgi:hypothetical protein